MQKDIKCPKCGSNTIDAGEAYVCDDPSCGYNIEKLRVYFVQGYSGGVKAGVYLDGVDHVIEMDHIKEVIEKIITEKGYTVEQTKRQKYPRVILNS